MGHRQTIPSIEFSSHQQAHALRSFRRTYGFVLRRGFIRALLCLTSTLSHTRPATLEKQNGPSPACWLWRLVRRSVFSYCAQEAYFLANNFAESSRYTKTPFSAWMLGFSNSPAYWNLDSLAHNEIQTTRREFVPPKFNGKPIMRSRVF